MIRLCANTGTVLHLIRPLGFRLDAKSVKRAGLDYLELADVRIHAAFGDCLETQGQPRWFAVSTRGTRRYDTVGYRAGDLFVFGPETRGLPQQVLERCPEEQRLRIPMRPGSRSMNLSNAVAVLVYEAWRQVGYGDELSPTRT